MNIYRNKKDRRLYLLYRVKPFMILGEWEEAIPYLWEGKVKKHPKLSDYELVGVR